MVSAANSMMASMLAPDCSAGLPSAGVCPAWYIVTSDHSRTLGHSDAS